MNEILSISIPTRNRSKCLNDLLDCLLKSIKFGNIDHSLIRIYISDNKSDDNTSQIVNNYLNILPITYACNLENIGMGPNIYQAYTAINGEYVWVIGDDDLIPESALSIVLSTINEKNPNLIILRGIEYRSFFPYPLQFNGYDEFAKYMSKNNPHYLIAHSLISVNVIKRSCFDKNEALNIMNSTKTVYGHMYGIAGGLLGLKGNVNLVSEETILVRKEYLGPVDGFWPDTIIEEQIRYLEWLKIQYKLKISPNRILPDYLNKIKPNIVIRVVNFIKRKLTKK